MKIAILGFGREGKAVLEVLKKSPKYDFAQIWILDQNPKLKIPAGLKAKKRLGKNYLNKLEEFDIVFRSPGVPFNLPEIQRAIRHNVIFSSATKLFFEQCTSRIIGVTGTKGKGTTATLLYQMLTRANFDVYLAGNIGRPALELLPSLKRHSLVVLELSSFQLQDLTIPPHMAVVLGIFPDHLDAHRSLKEYLDAKANVARYQTARDYLFYTANDRYARQIARQGRGKKTAVSPARFPLFTKKELKIPGDHNFRNAVMAATMAMALGCPKEIIRQTALEFPGVEHRLEFVRTWRTADGRTVDVYNDSASTNPQTLLAAAAAFDQPTIVIAGGHDKNLKYGFLAQALRTTRAMLVVLFGANKLKIKAALKRFPTAVCHTLAAAIETALANAPDRSVIIFSPGAASFDMFHDYADRGRQFKKLVHHL